MRAKIIKQVDRNFDEYYEQFIGDIANVLSADSVNDEYWLDVPNKYNSFEPNWCAEELEFIED